LVQLDLRIKYRRLRLLGEFALSRFTVNDHPDKAAVRAKRRVRDFRWARKTVRHEGALRLII